ncbi:MAG: T9SS type A sorting domain-containing protein [Ignavibacteria bacterium]|nr:T9SS type A sorting domain-containing protein [Ignavibacteria bacterium]
MVTDVTLTPTTLNLVVGESDSVFATVIPANAANKAISWSSSDTNVARVVAGKAEGSAVVTAGSRDGTAIITVTTEDGGHTATCVVTVRIPVTGVRLDRPALTISAGEAASLKARVLPSNATNKAVSWSSSDTRIATVAAGPTAGSAVVTAGDTAGTSIITVTTVDGSFTATCLVTVTIPVTGVTLSPTTLNLLSGETANIMATVLPIDATNQSLIWSSSDSSVALIAADGAGSAVVTAGYVDGTATITVTTEDGSFTASCVVTVTIPVTGVMLNKKMTINIGESASLTATVLPVDASNKAVTWSSSDPSVVKVVASNVAGTAIITAVGDIAGKATITVTTVDGEFSASCVVTVTIPVSGVTLSPTTLNLVAGETGNLSAALLPVDATNKSVTWSSDNPAVARVTVAHVSDVCIVRAINAGTATITVTTEEGNFTATCLVTVTGEAIPVSSVSVSPSSLALKVGESRNVTATVLPADATNKAITWSSDNPDVATVNNAGKVTGLAVGTATITVSTEDGGKTATCAVTVYKKTISVTGVTLDEEILTIKKGESASLTATVLPADATNKAVTWSSDNPDVATVDDVGKITALSAGTATITVTTVDGSFTASCVVTVTIPVTGVTLDKETLTINKGESVSLIVTVLPADATNKSVTWNSDKPKIAKVDNTGKITALSVGKATITVTTKEGGFTATCAVTVEDDGSVEELIASGVNVWTFNGVLHIDFKESVLSDRVVSIFDMSGKLVYSNSTPSDELQIHLPSGVYIVKVGDIAFKVLITQ